MFFIIFFVMDSISSNPKENYVSLPCSATCVSTDSKAAQYNATF